MEPTNRYKELGLVSRRLVVLLLAVTVVLSAAVVVYAARPTTSKNLTLPDCEVSVVDQKVVGEITCLNADAELRAWTNKEGGRPGELLLLTLKIECPEGTRPLEVDNTDVAIAFQAEGEANGMRYCAGAIRLFDEKPELSEDLILADPMGSGSHVGVHSNEAPSVQYLVAGFTVSRNADEVQLYVAQPAAPAMHVNR